MEKKTRLFRGEQALFPVTWEIDDATIDRIVDRVVERIEARRAKAERLARYRVKNTPPEGVSEQEHAQQIAEQVLRIIQARTGMKIIEG
jgi:hypothetical protein